MSRDGEMKLDPKTARLYDKRTVERSIKKGLVSRKDYEKHLKSLEDVAEKGVYGMPENDAQIEADEAESAEDRAASANEPSVA